jgi:hypothetical protein
MAFIPHTPDDVAGMLDVIGVRSMRSPVNCAQARSACRRR